MGRDVTDRLLQKFRDPEFREAYAESFLDSSIATQIKALREQRVWTQKELAEHAGMKQSRISSLEDVNYSSWSIATLKRLAKAFEVAPVFVFESFAELARRAGRRDRAGLERKPFGGVLLQHTQAETGPGGVSFTDPKDRVLRTTHTATNNVKQLAPLYKFPTSVGPLQPQAASDTKERAHA